MAKIEIITEGNETTPENRECIEVRIWGPGGRAYQPFFIGSGLNFSADGNAWIEVLYTIQGAQIFYTRNFLHLFSDVDTASSEARLDEIVASGEGVYGFGDMLPESSVRLKVEKGTYETADGQEQQYSRCELNIAADIGAVFDECGPGTRMIEIKLQSLELEEGVRFMRDLTRELGDAYHGKRPDPGLLAPGSSSWPLVRQLNQRAYDAISSDYQEKYFENPLIVEAFDGWLAQLPAGGHVLDAGCGHGDPVIKRLLEKGMQVTGTDLSRAMLKRARTAFPQVAFYNQITPELDFEGEFDGACSFSSTLYLDPVDLFHSIYRLYKALKPGGLLFLYGYDLHPGWRGLPYGVDIGQWMWSWTYSKEEAAQAVAEHGYFEVLSVCNVTTEEELEKRRQELEQQEEESRKRAEELRAANAANAEEPSFVLPQMELPPAEDAQETEPEGAAEPPELPFDLSAIPMPHFPGPEESMAYRYVIIARRKD